MVDTDASNVGVNGTVITYGGTAVTTATAATDSNGNAAKNLDARKTGSNLAISTTFGGNQLYAPATASSATTINVTA